MFRHGLETGLCRSSLRKHRRAKHLNVFESEGRGTALDVGHRIVDIFQSLLRRRKSNRQRNRNERPRIMKVLIVEAPRERERKQRADLKLGGFRRQHDRVLPVRQVSPQSSSKSGRKHIVDGTPHKPLFRRCLHFLDSFEADNGQQNRRSFGVEPIRRIFVLDQRLRISGSELRGEDFDVGGDERVSEVEGAGDAFDALDDLGRAGFGASRFVPGGTTLSLRCDRRIQEVDRVSFF